MRCSLVILPGGGGQQQEDAALADTAEQVAETVVDVALNMFFHWENGDKSSPSSSSWSCVSFFFGLPHFTHAHIHTHTYTDTHPCSPSTSWGRWGPSTQGHLSPQEAPNSEWALLILAHFFLLSGRLRIPRLKSGRYFVKHHLLSRFGQTRYSVTINPHMILDDSPFLNHLI